MPDVNTSGILDGSLFATANASAGVFLAGTIPGSSTFSSDITYLKPVSGVLSGFGTLGGTLDVTQVQRIAGSIDGVSSGSGTLNVYATQHTTLEGASAFLGSLGVKYVVSGVIAGDADWFGGLSVRHNTSMPLFISGKDTAENSIPLFIHGSYIKEKGITLFVKSDTPSAAANIPLFIKNDYSDADCPLIIVGDGTSDGFFPCWKGIPLFIRREIDSVGTSMPLYMCAVSGIPTNALTLYLAGAVIPSSGIPLVMPKVHSSYSQGLRLYTHGY